MKLLIGLCLLFCVSCGANTEKYFCVPIETTAAGFNKVITIENKDSQQRLSIPMLWKTEPVLNSVDNSPILISIYPESQFSNYQSFIVYIFNRDKNKLYTSIAIHVSEEEFTRIHMMPPTKENVHKVNTDPEALKHVPEKENLNWISYASRDYHYYNCEQLNQGEYILKSLYKIIDAFLTI